LRRAGFQVLYIDQQCVGIAGYCEAAGRGRQQPRERGSNHDYNQGRGPGAGRESLFEPSPGRYSQTPFTHGLTSKQERSLNI
jgi:hypothetical protein